MAVSPGSRLWIRNIPLRDAFAIVSDRKYLYSRTLPWLSHFSLPSIRWHASASRGSGWREPNQVWDDLRLVGSSQVIRAESQDSRDSSDGGFWGVPCDLSRRFFVREAGVVTLGRTERNVQTRQVEPLRLTRQTWS